MKVCNFVLALAAAALLASPAKAQLWAYESFEGGSADAALAGTSPTGAGFDGVWDITNGSGGNSMYEAAGLSYPGSYPGSNVAVGGNGRATGVTGDNAFLALDFDAATDAAVNGGGWVHISWLAQNVAQSTTDYGLIPPNVRLMQNFAAEYPRNSGIRLNNVGNGSNNALGIIGNSGNWNGSGGGAPTQSQFGDSELDPEVVDTWGAFNFNDVHNIFTGNNGSQSGPGSSDYNPAAANYDGVDHLVLSIDAASSTYHLQVNPQIDGSNDGELTWVHTDGAVVPFEMKAFGIEAGNDSSNRAPGDIVVDEIRIAGSFADAAGFAQVPEPSSLAALAGLIGLGLGAVRRR